MKTAFVGHFSPAAKPGNPASSAAGNQVQRQIIKELRGETRDYTVCYVMAPAPAWPRGALISESLVEDSVEFIGYLNLPVLKHLVFSAKLLVRLFRSKPSLCVQYNSYFFENLVLLLFRLLRPKVFLAILIQDVHVEECILRLSWSGLRSLSERLSLRFSRSFDLIVPISSEIVSNFKFPPSRCFVFQGGVTAFSASLMCSQQRPVDDFGVFAGSLEPHNGIDRLVNQWSACGIEHTLHVFGRGSLQNHVEQAAKCSSRIVFHGQQPEEAILQWQLRAGWNFCLRYSEGLNQKYFFPSKLFNIVCAPGAVVANDFHALPVLLRKYIGMVSEDLSDLPTALAHARAISTAEKVERRRKIVQSAHSWHSCIEKIIKRAVSSGRNSP